MAEDTAPTLATILISWLPGLVGGAGIVGVIQAVCKTGPEAMNIRINGEVSLVGAAMQVVQAQREEIARLRQQNADLLEQVTRLRARVAASPPIDGSVAPGHPPP